MAIKANSCQQLFSFVALIQSPISVIEEENDITMLLDDNKDWQKQANKTSLLSI